MCMLCEAIAALPPDKRLYANLRDYGGTCDNCGEPIRIAQIIGAMWLGDVQQHGTGVRWHYFQLPELRACTSCLGTFGTLRLYCGGAMDITEELRALGLPRGNDIA